MFIKIYYMYNRYVYQCHIKMIIKRMSLYFMNLFLRCKGAGLDCVIKNIFEVAMEWRVVAAEVRNIWFYKDAGKLDRAKLMKTSKTVIHNLIIRKEKKKIKFI